MVQRLLLVHPLIGKNSDVARLHAVVRIVGKPAACTDGKAYAVDEIGLGQRPDNQLPLFPLLPVVQIRLYDDRELVPADPERIIAASDAALKPPGNRLEQLIADRVPILVVDQIGRASCRERV